jgi:hypothetical protein
MGKREHEKPKQPPSGKAFLLSPDKAARLSALLDRFDIEPDPTQFQKYTRGGKVFFRYRDSAGPAAAGGGGGAAGGCIPWSATFTNVAGQDYVRFELGLLNQTAAGNWNTPLAIGPTDTKWPVLDVTASNGVITGYDIALDASPPTSDTVQEDTPPDTFKIVLGVIDSLSACMAVSQNLEASAIELFRKSKTPVAVGEEPFTRVWRWKVNQNTVGEYAYVT